MSNRASMALVDSKRAPSSVLHIDFEHYRKLHKRIAKSITRELN
jgi:hypothetical protein